MKGKGRGRPKKAPMKQIGFRIELDIYDWLQANGSSNMNQDINDILRNHISQYGNSNI